MNFKEEYEKKIEQRDELEYEIEEMKKSKQFKVVCKHYFESDYTFSDIGEHFITNCNDEIVKTCIHCKLEKKLKYEWVDTK